MIVEKGGERGYLTSNRNGGRGGDDIYQFELPAIKLTAQGIVTDFQNRFNYDWYKSAFNRYQWYD